jgi:hypothetical protein
MYKITGADGREYGPITLEQLIEWVRQGRVSPQTRVQAPGTTDWKPASEIVELQGVLGQMRGAAPLAFSAGAPIPVGSQNNTLATTSLVLGILSIICLGPFTGIPAIICGHIAHNRARRAPDNYGGSGVAIAGFATGYAGSVVGLIAMMAIFSAMLLPALARAKARAQEINCINNMKQVGLAFKTWEIDHQDEFPFNVSTNNGGTLELCKPGPDGFDQNGWMHLAVLSNELNTPTILVCPADNKQPAAGWAFLQSSNVTYLVRTGSSVNSTNPQSVLAICPIHNHKLLADGSVQQFPKQSRAKGSNRNN